MILFKQTNAEQLEKEWNDVRLDNRLRFIVYAISGYIKEYYNLNLLITEIYRTQEMQDEYYKDDPRYMIHKWDSVHQYWRGIDIRSSEMSQGQIHELVTWVNNQIIYGKEGIYTVKFHSVGIGYHFHIQVSGNNETVLRKVA